MHTRVVLGVVFILLKILAPSASQDYGSNLSDSSNITFTTPTSYNSIHAESTSQPISESTTIETSSTKVTASTTTTTTTQESVLDEFQLPENCSDYKVLTNQPQPSHVSTIKKCCPMHQHYKYSNGKKFCTNSSVEFHIDVIQAKFYENCIEDEEKNLTMNVVTENNCKNGLVFNKNYFDMLYVIQNGSLLRIDADYESYDIYEHYCLDMDEDEGVLTAIVCEFDDVLFHVNRAQALIFATCMVISVPCLVITAALYLLVPELKDLHGKSLACHSLSMATGFFLLAFTQFRDLYSFEGHFIQFCLLACFFWLTVMWIDICLHAWYYLPKGIKQTSQDDNLHLMYYGLFAFGLSLILVILTYKNNLSGLPSYYIKGTTQVARTSQKFFIPPISISLIVNLFLYVSSYFGFKHKVQKIKITTFIALKLKQCAKDNRLSASYIADMEKVETIMKSTAYLTIIMTINWIFEIISFYNDTSSTFFDIINALQGVLIFLMFVCLPRPMKLIKHWYKDRGSFQVIDNDDNRPCNDIQMTSLTNTSEKQTD